MENVMLERMDWSELRVLLRENFEFVFYNNKKSWGRTIKVHCFKYDDYKGLMKFIEGLGLENVSCRMHYNGPWEYVMIDIKK